MKTEPIGRLDHVGIAVRSIDQARAFFEGALGATFRFAKEDPSASFRFAVFDLAGFTIELLEPIDPAGFLSVFLQKRGEGVHHITLQTPALKEKVAFLEGKGIRVVDQRLDDSEFREAFVSPKSACGVLFQLADTCPPLDNEPYWK
jgi:methylmalonyl-CoA/ethylmalonyl-CoA epimerase